MTFCVCKYCEKHDIYLPNNFNLFIKSMMIYHLILNLSAIYVLKYLLSFNVHCSRFIG